MHVSLFNPSSPYRYQAQNVILLLHISSPNSEKCTLVPFSKANHFAFNAVFIPDLFELPSSLFSKRPFPLVHKTRTLFSLSLKNPFPDNNDDDCNDYYLLKPVGHALYQEIQKTEPLFHLVFSVIQ